jgi:hypothetical protein
MENPFSIMVIFLHVVSHATKLRHSTEGGFSILLKIPLLLKKLAFIMKFRI